MSAIICTCMPGLTPIQWCSEIIVSVFSSRKQITSESFCANLRKRKIQGLQIQFKPEIMQHARGYEDITKRFCVQHCGIFRHNQGLEDGYLTILLGISFTQTQDTPCTTQHMAWNKLQQTQHGPATLETGHCAVWQPPVS